MHNLHFILVKADSADEAASTAENDILHWGNENNWRSIGGIASEDGSNDIENHADGGWGLSYLDTEDNIPKEGTYFSRAVAYLKQMINDPVRLQYAGVACGSFREAIKTITDSLLAFDPEKDTPHELWTANQNIKQLYEILSARKAEQSGSDIPEFYEWQFDQEGLTDLTHASEGTRRYILFLDMHS